MKFEEPRGCTRGSFGFSAREPYVGNAVNQDRNVTDPRLILLMIEYIHNNPVRRKLVEKPEEWKWSSAGWVEGKNSLRPDPIDFGGLTGMFGGEV